jgi:hypothetical protein
MKRDGNLPPRKGFDWKHVKWGAPDARRSALCSYCSAGIPDDDVPLILWKADGSAAQFCKACCIRWWGFQEFDDDENDD